MYFFIQKSAVGLESDPTWKKLSKVKNPPPVAGEYDAVTIQRISPLVLNFKKLTEWVLIAALLAQCQPRRPSCLEKTAKVYIYMLFLSNRNINRYGMGNDVCDLCFLYSYKSTGFY